MKTHQFSNGDRLLLEATSGVFAFPLGHLHYFQLTYSEKDTCTYGTKEKPAFLASQTEYFSITDEATAIEAFQLRLSSGKPAKACGLGYSLGDVKARS
jgi:hypothetical protein